MSEFWYYYECYECTDDNESGCVLDVRVDFEDREQDLLVKCPWCGGGMQYKGCDQATETGHKPDVRKDIWMVYKDSEGTWFCPFDPKENKLYNAQRYDAEAFIHMFKEGVSVTVNPPPKKDFEMVARKK